MNPSTPTSVASTRRKFIRSAAGAGTAVLAFPNILRGRSPNEKLNVACVGVGGMAGGASVRHAESSKNARVVALCDVDANILDAESKKNPDAKTFSDYRVMLEKMEKDIDAVTVATPDHMHGPIVLAAMDLGKPIYCQKPLAHNIAEARKMTRMAAEKGVVTQIGTQIHSRSEYRSAVAALRAGVIGKVSEVHTWVNASWAGPPEKRPEKTDPVPAHLDWNLWQGIAPRRPFVNGLYVPYQWRRWKEYGAGTLGDFGCHLFDCVFSALDLAPPVTVRSTGPSNFEETFAPDSRVQYGFAATKRTTGPLKMTWAEKVAPIEAAKPHLPAGALPKQGSLLIGTNGTMAIPHVGFARIYRDGKLINGKVQGEGSINHEHEWIEACRGEGETSTPFSYSGPLSEAVLLGTIASSFKDEELQWNHADMRFSNSEAATGLVYRSYEPGFEIGK